MADETQDAEVRPFFKIDAKDEIECRLVIEQVVETLGKLGKSRQKSLAITKLEEAYLWLGEDLRKNAVTAVETVSLTEAGRAAIQSDTAK